MGKKRSTASDPVQYESGGNTETFKESLSELERAFIGDADPKEEVPEKMKLEKTQLLTGYVGTSFLIQPKDDVNRTLCGIKKRKLLKEEEDIDKESQNDETNPFTHLDKLMTKIKKFKKEMEVRRWLKKQLLKNRLTSEMKKEAIEAWKESVQLNGISLSDAVKSEVLEEQEVEKTQVLTDYVGTSFLGNKNDDAYEKPGGTSKRKLLKVKAIVAMESLKEDLKPFADLEELMVKVNKFKKEMEVRRWLKKQLLRKRLTLKMRNEAMDAWKESLQQKGTAKLEELSRMQGSLEAVKAEASKLAQQGLITRGKAGLLVQKWKRREHRRLDRQLKHTPSNLSCFHCREMGHIMADCPKLNSSTTEAAGICFKCGSTEHQIYQCKRQNVKGFPYASCFVCGERGHISRDCEKNTNGIYIGGGSCDRCGSKMHLAKDCGGVKKEETTEEEKKEKKKTIKTQQRQDALVKAPKREYTGDDDDFFFAEELEGEVDASQEPAEIPTRSFVGGQKRRKAVVCR